MSGQTASRGQAARSISMEPWGEQLFGNPCHECGFHWGLTPHEAVHVIQDCTDAFTEATQHATGNERREGWSVTEYTSHVADNLRQWAERVQAARLAGQTAVAGYDPDALAHARAYDAIPLPVALWSLRVSTTQWVEVLTSALAERIVLDHATRGEQRAQDIARNNAHDATHHLWDIHRILRS